MGWLTRLHEWVTPPNFGQIFAKNGRNYILSSGESNHKISNVLHIGTRQYFLILTVFKKLKFLKGQTLFPASRNRFQGINSASLCSLAWRYDNPISTRFLAPHRLFKNSSTVMNFWKGRDMFLCLYLVTAHAVGRWYPTLVCAHAEKRIVFCITFFIFCFVI